ncbi:MAG: protein kinase [Gammaproteobacteria bacterium]
MHKELPNGDGKAFTVIRTLGEGAYGIVELCLYHGSEPDVLRCCDQNGYVARKTLKSSDHNQREALRKELAIARYLKDSSIDHDYFSSPFSIIAPLRDQSGTEIGIISQCVAFHYDENTLPITADLSNFLKLLYVSDPCINGTILELYSRNPAIFLSHIFSSMEFTQRSVNKTGVLHLDIACRNYLVGIPSIDLDGNLKDAPLTLGDFGRSEKVGEGQVVIKGDTVVPLRWMDINSIQKNTHTIRTDIFALKVSMIEAIGYALGVKDPIEILQTNPNSNERLFLLSSKEKDLDDVRLKGYFQNVLRILEHFYYPLMKHQIMILMDAYEDYLINTPLPSLDMPFLEALDENRKALESAQEKFLMLMRKAEIDSLEDGKVSGFRRSAGKPGVNVYEEKPLRTNYEEAPAKISTLIDTEQGLTSSSESLANISDDKRSSTSASQGNESDLESENENLSKVIIKLHFARRPIGIVGLSSEGSQNDLLNLEKMKGMLKKEGYKVKIENNTLNATNAKTGKKIQFELEDNRIIVDTPTEETFQFIVDYIKSPAAFSSKCTVCILSYSNTESLENIYRVFNQEHILLTGSKELMSELEKIELSFRSKPPDGLTA